MIFQAASEDETTQRNGLVAIYSRYDDNLKQFLQLAFHQAECMRLFDAVPLRYSAFHLFLPDDIHAIRGVMMNMVGKKIRLITQGHTGAFSIFRLCGAWRRECMNIPFPFHSIVTDYMNDLILLCIFYLYYMIRGLYRTSI